MALDPKTIKHLDEIHPDLKAVLLEVAKYTNFVITETIRDQATQHQYFLTGKSKVDFPNSMHNVKPGETTSRAADTYPAPILHNIDSPKYVHQMYFFGGFVMAIAKSLGKRIRWGGDWNGNMDVKDQNFNDLPHFEVPI